MLLTALLCSVSFSAPAWAISSDTLPQNGQVVAGDATFDYETAKELHIQQNSDRTIINWDSFDVGEEALVEFHQNGAGSIAVNRVMGAGDDPTKILGQLRANGKVVVLDRNGVVFGKNSKIDVGSIVVGAGDIDTDAFMAGGGKIAIKNVNSDAKIENNGEITVADAGLAAFVAPNVTNNGIIRAKAGRVQIGAGKQATIDLYGDGLVELAVDDGLETALIENNGMIEAEGGVVHITASMAKETVDAVINMDGVTSVASATKKGGKIILEGADTRVSGQLDASGANGGGEILIGGDYQGGGTIRHAGKTIITSDAEILANALNDGDGGKIIAWSDDDTRVAGHFEAKGGANGGNGGLIETSAKKHLNVDKETYISVAAPQGDGGQWLIDPEDIVISDVGDDGDPNTSDVSSATINTALNGGGEVLITTNGVGPGTGNITVTNANFDKSVANTSATLRLVALNDIIMDTVTLDSSSNDAVNVILNADSDGGMDGGVKLTSTTIDTKGGNFVAGGGADPTTSRAYGSTDGVTDHGVQLSNSHIDTGTGSGSVTLLGYGETTGDGNRGVQIEGGSTITTDAGTIKIDGWGGDSGGNSNIGVVINGASTITTTSGVIDIDGRGESNASTGRGVNLNAGSKIKSLGSGTVGEINILGIGDDNSSDDNGFRMDDVGTRIESEDADIVIEGRSTAGIGVYLRGDGTTSNQPRIITYGEGDINITARSTNSRAYEMNEFVQVRAADAGNVSIDAQGVYGYYLRRADILAKDGNVELIGRSSNSETFLGDKQVSVYSENGNVLFSMENTVKFSNTSSYRSANGNFTLAASNISNTGGSSSFNAGQTLTIKAFNAGDSIVLGSGSGDATFTQADFDNRFNAGTKLVVGDSASPAGDVTIDTLDLSGETYDMEVYGENITSTGFDGPDSILLRADGGIVTLDGALSATGVDESVVIAGDSFVNNAGASAIDAGTGRFLIYVDQFTDLTAGGLTAKNVYGKTYPTDAPSGLPSGNRFAFQQQPTLTVTVDDAVQNTTTEPNYTYTISGVRMGDLIAEAYSGAPVITKGNAQSRNVFDLNAALGSLTSTIGYNFNFVPATLTVNLSALSETSLNDTFALDQDTLLDTAISDQLFTQSKTVKSDDVFLPEDLNYEALEGVINLGGSTVPALRDNEDYAAQNSNQIQAAAGSASCMLTNAFNGACIIAR